jgi:acyl carrier protein
MLDGSLDESIVDVLSILLRVPAAAITKDFSQSHCETWDSVRHLMIMLAIEEKFDVTFDEKEIGSLTSAGAIATAVQARLVKS